MKPRTYLIIAGIAILAIWLLKDMACNSTTPAIPAEVDSMAKAHRDYIDSATRATIDREFYIRDQQVVINQLHDAMTRATAVIAPQNKKMLQLVEANRRLKAANDTLGRLSNCDTLAEVAGKVGYLQDSITNMRSGYDTLISDLINVQSEAIAAEAAKYQAEKKQRIMWESVARTAASSPETSRSSPFTFGFHGGYGISSGGLSPVLSVGINYEIRPRSFLKSLFKRKP